MTHPSWTGIRIYDDGSVDEGRRRLRRRRKPFCRCATVVLSLRRNRRGIRHIQVEGTGVRDIDGG